MYMFRYRRAKKCKACVKNDTNSCATNITIAQPRNAPPKPNRQKAIKIIEDGKEVPTFVPNQNTVQDSYFYLDESNRKVLNLKIKNKLKTCSLRDAVSKIVIETALPKNLVYNQAMKIKKNNLN